MFTIQTAVTIVTAGLASELFGLTENMVIWSVIITVFCSLILIFVYLAINLRRFIDDEINFEKKAQNLFYFSIIYLFNIFAIILVDNLIWNYS